MSQAKSSTSDRGGRRRRWGRRLLVAGITLAIVLVVAVVIIQVVLSGDLPRRLIISGLERALGVRVEVERVRTGWFGRTELRGLKLTFPLADEPFVHAAAVEVEHTHLIPLLLRRPLRIERAVAEDPELLIQQTDTGRWNIQALMTRGGEPAGPSRGITLPDIGIRNGTLRIVDRAGREARFDGVTITGTNEASFVYAMHVDAPAQLALDGRINLRDGQHAFDVVMGELAPTMQALVPAWPKPLNGRGRWTGGIAGGQLRGQAHLQSVRAMDFLAHGQVKVELAGDGLVLSPDDLTVQLTDDRSPAVELISGHLRVTDDALIATDLRATTGEGAGLVNGRWSFATSTAELAAQWEALTLPQGLTHSGRLQFELRKELNGEPRISVELSNQGKAPAMEWTTDLRVQAAGPDWAQLTWNLDVSRFRAQAPELELNLDGLTASVARRENRLVLDQLTLPGGGELEGRGEIALDGDRDWYLTIQCHRLPLPQLQQRSAELTLDMVGNAQQVRVRRLYGRAGDLELNASGDYDNKRPRPLGLQVTLSHPTPTGVVAEDQPPLIGGLDASGTLEGNLWPSLDLEFALAARARALRIYRREIGDVDFSLAGQARPGRVEWRSEELNLLGGAWRFSGDINTARSNRSARIRVGVRDMAAKRVGDLFKLEGVAGTIAGSWTIDIPRLEPSRLTVDGTFRARDIALAPTGKEEADLGADRGDDEIAPTHGVLIESASGRTVFANQVLRVQDVVLQQRDGEMTGELAVNVTEPEFLRTNLVFSKWRIDLPAEGAALQLYGTSELAVNLARRTILGPFDLATDIILHGDKVGEASLNGRFDGRGVQLPTMQANAFGGRMWGKLVLDIDQPLRSNGLLQFNDIDGQAIASLWPAVEGLTGLFRGVVELRPANPENRPIAPLRLTAFVDPTDAAFRAGQIGPMTFDAYIDTRAGEAGYTDSPLRLVLDQARLNLFGGDIEAWSRLTRHTGGQVSAQTNVRYQNVSLQQILQTFVTQDDEPVPGMLAGDLTIVGNPFDRERVFGQGTVRLTQSDLANLAVFAALYNLMNINIRTQEPIGAGEIAFRLEGQSAEVTRMSYFNRGTEVRAIGEFRKVWDLPETEVDLTVVGTARPFKDIKLPFAADVEEVLATLQGDVTTVRVTGTVHQPQISQLAFQQIGQAMRAILLGDVQREAQRK